MKSFDEAINIRMADIDITTGERISHSEKYTRAINLIGGLDAVIPLIPFSLELIKDALEHHDEHLNTLPLKRWDNCVPSVKALCYRKAGISYMSLSQGVCVLKEAARQWAERGH